jgi:hypothetical protein
LLEGGFMRLGTFHGWRSIVCGLAFVLFYAAASDASSTKDQAFEPATPDTIPTIWNNFRWGQTFTVGTTGTLTRVDVLVAQMFNVQPESLDVTIFDTVSGAPRAALTVPAHLLPSSVPIVPHPSSFDNYAYLSATFTLPVTAGDVLAIVVSTGTSSQYFWAGVNAGGYPGGQLYQTTGGAWSRVGSEDQAFRTFVAPSGPPTAVAGTNQTVRMGTTVNLDGSGSYDDNTETSLLHYAWSFLSVPPGSARTTLTDASTIGPSFVPDVAGNYVVQLVVTDQDGLSSQPSQVTIGENLPPTANAGPDQLVLVNQVVTVSGTVADPDADSITIDWRLTSMPTGSTAHLAPSDTAATTLVPDLPGVYVATLTPSDFVGHGTPANATITATTATTYVEIQSQEVATRVQGLVADAVTTSGNQNAFVQLLSNVVTALQNGNFVGARQQLELALSRTDGCALRGVPDGNGPGRDWIISCAAQQEIYAPLMAALSAINP